MTDVSTPEAATSAHVRLLGIDAAGVARVQISNPGKLNAMSLSMWSDLRTIFEGLQAGAEAEGGARVVIIDGADDDFVAGGDIEEFPRFRFDPAQLARFHEDIVAPALHALYGCDVPVIARIRGACVGGGLEIAACCDLRFCDAASRFGVPIARLGFPMAPAEVEIVSRAIGPTLLRELLVEARLLEAAEAERRGLVTRVLPSAAALSQEVARVAASIAALSPQAMRLNKRVLREFAGWADRPAGPRHAHFAYADSAEHREGLQAFLEKRPAKF
jgi:enoyl-CoA hydratase/carnithine racemase